MIVLGYQELAAPACHGQPHTLPPDSQTLAGYPCNGSSMQRLFYVAYNARLVVWDCLNVGLQDRYLSYCTVALITRLLAPLILPASLYCQVCAVHP
jgi:hypothetical protein